jgi:hypothetical protein
MKLEPKWEKGILEHYLSWQLRINFLFVITVEVPRVSGEELIC